MVGLEGLRRLGALVHEGQHVLFENPVLHADPGVLELLAPKQLIDGTNADVQQRCHLLGGQDPGKGFIGRRARFHSDTSFRFGLGGSGKAQQGLPGAVAVFVKLFRRGARELLVLYVLDQGHLCDPGDEPFLDAEKCCDEKEQCPHDGFLLRCYGLGAVPAHEIVQENPENVSHSDGRLHLGEAQAPLPFVNGRGLHAQAVTQFLPGHFAGLAQTLNIIQKNTSLHIGLRCDIMSLKLR